MMPGSPERKTVELPDLTPAAPGTPGLEEKGEEEWEGENGLYADERGEQGDLGREEYQSLYENGNENDNDNDDKHGCEYKHRYEYDYVKDNENGERYSIENRNGKRNAEQVEVTSVLPIVGDRQDSSKGGEEGEAKRKCVGENGVEAEAEAGAGTEVGGEQEQEVDDMLVTDAVEAKINRKVRVRLPSPRSPTCLFLPSLPLYHSSNPNIDNIPLPPPSPLPSPFPFPPRQRPPSSKSR